MMDKRGTIVKTQELKNGIELILYDLSRIITGDRWLVELQCEAKFRLQTGYGISSKRKNRDWLLK